MDQWSWQLRRFDSNSIARHRPGRFDSNSIARFSISSSLVQPIARRKTRYCSSIGICFETDPKGDLVKAWSNHIADLGATYSPLPSATDEQPVLDHKTGLALFGWPQDVEINEELSSFDVLLMTANSPTLTDGQYPSVKQIASAWRNDTADNVMYFYNNRHVGVTTFEDDDILRFLRGETA